MTQHPTSSSSSSASNQHPTTLRLGLRLHSPPSLPPSPFTSFSSSDTPLLSSLFSNPPMMQSMPELRLVPSSSPPWKIRPNIQDKTRRRLRNTLLQHPRTRSWLVFFTIRWWDPATFAAMHPEGSSARASWPYVESKTYLWTWLFVVPLVAYSLWQLLYFLIVNVLRRQRLLRDPEVMTSYRELSKKAQKANNLWWRLSGLLGDQNRLFMYIVLQAIFTVATMALTVPIFLSYELHVVFQILKVSASVWNGGSFLLEVMPRQVILKEKKKKAEVQPTETQVDQTLEVQPIQMRLDQSLNHDAAANNSVEIVEASPNLTVQTAVF